MKKTYRYLNEHGQQEFTVSVKLSSDFKIYVTTADLPEDLRDEFDYAPKQIKGDEWSEVNSQIQELIAGVESKLVEEMKSKVICYKFEFGKEHRNCPTFMSLEYWVVTRVERKRVGKVDVEYYDEEIERGTRYGGDGSLRQKVLKRAEVDSDAIEMKWTPEREAWFKLMTEQFISLGQRMEEGFGKSGSRSGELLGKQIDRSATFLIEGKTDVSHKQDRR